MNGENTIVSFKIFFGVLEKRMELRNDYFECKCQVRC